MRIYFDKRRGADNSAVAGKKSYTVTEQSFYDPQGRRRLYMLVESIDQKLEELTRSFLEKQMDSLDLVNRLDEIAECY